MAGRDSERRLYRANDGTGSLLPDNVESEPRPNAASAALSVEELEACFVGSTAPCDAVRFPKTRRGGARRISPSCRSFCDLNQTRCAKTRPLVLPQSGMACESH